MERPLSTERIQLGGIPVLHLFPREAQGPMPTIYYYHGWSSRKESHVVTASAFACEGFRVFLPDAPHHGDRDPFPDYSQPETLRNTIAIVMQAVVEIGRMTEEAIGLGLADLERMGVAGSSMGGMIAAGAMARYDRIRAGVLFNGCPCYEWLAGVYQERHNSPPPTEAELRGLREFDPVGQAARIAPRPLLMTHGTSDTTVPIDGARRFIEVAAPFYSTFPERLRLSEYPRLDHYVTTGMITEARDWFCAYL